VKNETRDEASSTIGKVRNGNKTKMPVKRRNKKEGVRNGEGFPELTARHQRLKKKKARSTIDQSEGWHGQSNLRTSTARPWGGDPRANITGRSWGSHNCEQGHLGGTDKKGLGASSG